MSGKFGICAALCALVAWPVLAEPQFEVGHVASDDVLNVRAGPSPACEILDRLPPAFGGLHKEVCVLVKPDPHQAAPAKMPEWCLIGDRSGRLGWVNARFLVPDVVPSAPESLRLIAGYRSYDDACRLIGESAAVIDFLDHTADLVGCPAGHPGIAELRQEMGAQWVAEIEGYVLVSVPGG